MPQRTLIVGKRHAGRPLGAILSSMFRLSQRDVEHHLKNRWVRLDDEVCRHANHRVRAGQRIQVVVPRPSTKPSRGTNLRVPRVPPAGKSQSRSDRIPIVFCDDHILVVEKPAGLTTVRHADEAKQFGDRAKRFLPPTLVDELPRFDPELRRGRIRAVHRLDKETSGLVVLARTAAAESALGKQFRAHAVERTYLALVRGQAKSERIESTFVVDRGDGRRGSGADSNGQHAVTHVRVVEPFGAFTLVECRLETGRTHQVRIHLGERGTPLCGERIYDRPRHGQPLPDGSGAKRPMLHAATLALIHPATGKRMAWESEMPADMRTLTNKLRAKAGG